MSYVSCRACAQIVHAVRAAGHDPAALLEGLPFSVADLEEPTRRVPWDEFTVWLERVAAQLGGSESLRQAAIEQFDAPGFGLIDVLVRPLGSIRAVYSLGARWYGPTFFPCTRARVDELDDGRLRQTVEILRPYRESPEFFHMMRGVLEVAPTILRRPRARVTMTLEPRRAVYTIEPPAATPWAGWLRRLFSGDEAVSAALAELQFQQAELEEAHRLEREKSAQLEREIEQRHESEAHLRHAQKMEAVGLLAGGLAHEFSNILTAIGAYGDLARSAPEAEIEGHLDEIQLAVTRGTGVIRRLLAFSRRPMTMTETLDLNALLLDLEPMLGALLGEKVVLALDLGRALHPIRGDRGQLEQVVVNLAVNARDAMPEGGRLTLRTENGLGRSGEEPAGELVRLEVRDTGVGMEGSVLARAFEPFFTTKPRERGTGLGLFAVWGIARQHGGVVSIASELDKGTCVELRFPRAEGEAAVRAELRVRGPAPGGREGVLLIEDEPQVRSVTGALLETAGYRVHAVADAAEALTLGESSSDPIDIVVTDVVLPGVDGREAVRRLRSVRPGGWPVLFVSGHADAEPEGPLDGPPDDAPRQGFLRKPYTREALLRAVRVLLDG